MALLSRVALLLYELWLLNGSKGALRVMCSSTLRVSADPWAKIRPLGLVERPLIMKSATITIMCDTLNPADLLIRDVECHELLGHLALVYELCFLKTS